jgi:hypothetical protein
MGPKRRRSSRLMIKEDSKTIEEENIPEKIEEQEELEEEDALDLEALVSQTYDFMVSRVRDITRNQIPEENDKPEKSNPMSVELSDVIKLSSTREYV